jgi:hypothetical protein
VILRSEPNTKSKVLTKLDAIDTVEIISIGKSEKIGRFGEHHWYQVKTMWDKTGWVFGAFLEPVEQEVK